MSRDRHTAIEWGQTQKGQRPRVLGYCDFGFQLVCREEMLVYSRLKSQGYAVTKFGWPDFLATKAGEARLIEVKSKNDRLTESQKRVFQALKDFGVPVEITKVLVRGSTKGQAPAQARFDIKDY